ncbi:hypothetical protein JCM6882_005851 [Rhodosporidiobolus microsporus]
MSSRTLDAHLSASTEPSQPPSIFLLPTELLLHILSFLSYLDLHHTRRVCRAFRTVVEDSSLDAALFRPHPPKLLRPGTAISIHPFLHRIDGLASSSHTIFLSPSPSSPSPPFSHSLVNAFSLPSPLSEVATSPPAHVLLLDLQYGHVALSSSSASGVTVRAVLEALCDFWTTKTDPAGPFLSSVKKEWANVGVSRFVRVGPARWRGWKKAWVRVDGAVVLEAKVSYK